MPTHKRHKRLLDNTPEHLHGVSILPILLCGSTTHYGPLSHTVLTAVERVNMYTGSSNLLCLANHQAPMQHAVRHNVDVVTNTSCEPHETLTHYGLSYDDISLRDLTVR